MINFHDTVLGRRFFEGQLPKLIETLGRIADCMEKEQERQVCVKETSEGVCPKTLADSVDDSNI